MQCVRRALKPSFLALFSFLFPFFLFFLRCGNLKSNHLIVSEHILENETFNLSFLWYWVKQEDRTMLVHSESSKIECSIEE